MQPLLEMKDITKIYPNGVAANEGACFSLAEGEIHAVAGENGAGKSTLMKMLSGAEKPTSGEIFFRGERVNFRSAKDAQALGIGMVWQHFMLVNEFPVYRNIFLGCEDCGKLGFLREKKMRVAAEELAGKYDMAVDIRAKCGDLPVGQAQKVEILKVLARGAKVLILDEPTAVLTPQETEELFRQLLLLKEDGCSIVIITHKLREIKRLCDRVTVMRAGRTLGTYDVSEVTEEDISRLMVGSSVKTEPDKLPFSPGEEVANVSDLHISGRGGKEAVSGVSFAVHRGEILGLAGVEGNGQKEAAEVLCGLIRKYRGLVTVEGQELAGRSVRRIRALGVALHHAHRAAHAQGKVLVLHGLDHKVEGVHCIAAHGVLGEVGHKDDGRHRVGLSHDLGRLHAADAGQADVQEHDVRGGAALEELEGRGEHLDGERRAVLGAVAGEMRPQHVRGGRVVLYDERSVHGHPLLGTGKPLRQV